MIGSKSGNGAPLDSFQPAEAAREKRQLRVLIWQHFHHVIEKKVFYFFEEQQEAY